MLYTLIYIAKKISDPPNKYLDVNGFWKKINDNAMVIVLRIVVTVTVSNAPEVRSNDNTTLTPANPSVENTAMYP